MASVDQAYSITTQGVDGVAELLDIFGEDLASGGLGSSNVGVEQENDRLLNEVFSGSVGKTIAVFPTAVGSGSRSCESAADNGKGEKSCRELHFDLI
jgi:hypothetical protein